MPAFKRPVSGAVGQHTKSARVAVKEPKKPALKGCYAQVVKGLAASDLPQHARDMLADMAVACLGIAKGSRDKYQSKVVEMTEDVLTSVEEGMQKKVEELERLIAEATKTREELDGKSVAKGEEIEAKCGQVLAKKQELAEMARSFKIARVAAEEAQMKIVNVEADAKAKAKEKELLTSLRDGLEGPFEAGGVDALCAKLKALGISDSMMVALPAVLGKPASERGSFDAMVLTSVLGELDARIAAAEEVIQNAEPAKAVAIEALHAAEAALKEANKMQVDSAAAYRKVHEQEEALGKEADELKAASRKARDTCKKHHGQNSTSKRRLEEFQKGSKQAFEDLRDKIELVPEPIPELVEAEAVAPEVEAEVAAEAESAEVVGDAIA